MHALKALIILLTIHKYNILFPISIVEGPVIIVIAGVLCSTGTFTIPTTYLVLLASDTIGSTFYYLIGRIGGNPLVHKLSPILHIKEAKLVKIENHIQQRAVKTILIGKTQIIGGAFSIAAGMSKITYPKFILINFLGSIPKIAILLFAGFITGRAYGLINYGLKIYGALAALILVMALAIHYFKKQKRKIRSTEKLC